MSTKAESFDPSMLPQFTKAEVQINNLFFSNLFSFEKIDQWQSALSAAASNVFQTQASFIFESAEIIHSEEYFKLLANNDCLSFMIMPPKNGFLLVDTPYDLTSQLIYRALGKKDESKNRSGNLTEVEEGIFKYVLMKTLGSLREVAKAHNLPLQITSVKQKSQTDSSKLDLKESFTVVGFTVTIESQQFFTRIVLSQNLIRDLRGFFARPKDKVILETARKRTRGVRIPAVVSVGKVSLHRNDYENLEVEDIIVLDNTSLKLKNIGLSGEIHCHIGEKEFGSFLGNLVITPTGRYAVQVKDLLPAKSMSDT